jgi:hypothetical protein
MNREICSKCKQYLGTWKRGSAHGIRCKVVDKKSKHSFTWKQGSDIPENCPYVLEQVVSDEPQFENLPQVP